MMVSIQVSIILIQLGLLLLKHDVVWQILYLAASQHALIERAGSRWHSLNVLMSVVTTSF